jgi:uncharacterized protein
MGACEELSPIGPGAVGDFRLTPGVIRANWRCKSRQAVSFKASIILGIKVSLNTLRILIINVSLMLILLVAAGCTSSPHLTPLSRAAKEGDVAKVKSLLGKGMNVNERNGSGTMALTLAADWGRDEIVQILLSNGADVNNVGGLSPLYGAAKAGHTNIVRTLLAAGAKDGPEYTVLMQAATYCRADTVKFLALCGSDVNATLSGGYTALMRAAWTCDIDTVRALLEAGANVNAKDDKGTTALNIAAAWGKPEVVSLLLAKGADVNAIDNRGATAFGVAASGRRQDVMEILKQHGARPESYLK